MDFIRTHPQAHILCRFYRYFGRTFRMAQLASGCFCLNTDNFIEYSCPDYFNCPKCKENCPPPKKKRLSLKKGKQCGIDKENDPRFKFLMEAEFEKLKEGYTPLLLL